MTTARPGARLTGYQWVAIAAALCVAVVLAPAGVYAAAIQKVRVVGAARTVPNPPATPFHRGQLVSDTTSTLGARVPAGKGLAITSVSTAWLAGMTTSDGREGLRIVVRKATSSGSCPSSGAVLGVVLHVLPTPDVPTAPVDRVFPVPQVWRATNTGLCLQVDAGVAGFPVVVDGYLY